MEAGAGLVAVEVAGDLDTVAPQSYLLLVFAQRGVDGATVVRLDAAAGKAHLPRVMLQMIGAPGQQHGEAARVFDQRD